MTTSAIHNWTIARAAQALNAQCVGDGSIAYSGASIDSRTIARGQLFVALKGPNFDAHDFVASVAAQGAAGAIVNKPIPIALPQIVVPDTRIALGQLAQSWRSQFTAPIVAITGSNGKTSVKEMLASILSKAAGNVSAVLTTEGNLNNDYGVPLMMLRMNAQHRFIALEMGMNHLGELDYLTKLAKPDVAIINNAGRAHIGELGSLDAIAQAKGEIYAGLSSNGIAIINLDDTYADYWKGLNKDHRIMTFGLTPKADVNGLDDGQLRVSSRFDGATIDLVTQLAVPGEHNVRNALAAAACAFAIGISADHIAAGLRDYRGTKGRLERKAGAGGCAVIDDTYNANPDSMKAAIRVLAKAQGRRLLVLGDIGEMGAYARAMHEEVGAYARSHQIDELYVIGKHVGDYAKGFGASAQVFDELEDLVAAVQRELEPTATVLVKGSRSARMERVVERLIVNGKK
jgi:UDP-N-acetylmuramoyl-tripeptide--D-alanyl-D-alanine ligase